MSYQHKQFENPENHLLRRFFDTLYEMTPANINRAIHRVPRRVWWLTLSAVAGLVLMFVILEFVNMGLQMVEEANRPTLAESLEAPYGLGDRVAPAISISAEMINREVPVIEPYIAEVVEEASPAVETVAESTTDATSENDANGATDPALGGNVEAAAIVDKPDIIIPVPSAEEVAAYFYILPEFPGYARSFIRTDLGAYGTLDCLVGMEATVETCGLAAAPNFVEAADYLGEMAEDGTQPHARMVVVQYDDAQTARESLRTLRLHADKGGVLANFAMGDTQFVSYMHALTHSQHMFAWANDNWVYMISSADMEIIEDIIAHFYH